MSKMNTKVDKNDFKKSVYDTDFSPEEINLIWDFYVTHQIVGSDDVKEDSLNRSVKDYGWQTSNSKLDGYLAIEFNMIQTAEMDDFIIKRTNKLAKHLADNDLKNDHLVIEHPRAVLKQNYTCTPDEDEIAKNESKESRIAAIFRHIRNSLAHGNTYFFENGYVLLEDKEGKTITAAILLKKQTLLDWIYVVDKNNKFYSRKNIEVKQ